MLGLRFYFYVACLSFSLFLAMPSFVYAQDALTGLARAENDGSFIQKSGKSVKMQLRLSQPVPYRIFFLDAPRRMVVDFSTVDWTGFNRQNFVQTDHIDAVRVGVFRPGWSRMVLDLTQALKLNKVQLSRDDLGAVLTLDLVADSAENYAENAGTPLEAQLVRSTAASDPAAQRQRRFGEGKIHVTLDPGHGGIDPGAERSGVRESDLMLSFAQELRDVLIRSGRFDVTLTRSDDSFVPLEARITVARSAAADVFISLHADALAEGRAEGATVYTLAKEATDEASRKLAERHDRSDLLSGIDLTDQDDVIAGVLLDMARTETNPRTERFVSHLVGELSKAVGMHKRPRLEAGFSVLKSADIPSVLLELGFLSSDKDRQNLSDPAWRTKAALAIREALVMWEIEELSLRDGVRK